jgi:hypothetical protein
VNVTGAATGSGPLISTLGSDTNIELNITTKGTGNVNFTTGNGIGFRVYDGGAGTVVNQWNVRGSTSINSPVLWATGTDTNVSGVITSGGNGSLLFRTNNNGVDQFRVTHTASAVNFIQATGATTGNRPTISVQG